MDIPLKTKESQTAKVQEIEVAGVDYSAASKDPNATWLSLGTLSKDSKGIPTLGFEHIDNTGSIKIAASLLKNKPISVGFDFPFSTPKIFQAYLVQNSSPEASQTAAQQAIQAPAKEKTQSQRYIHQISFEHLSDIAGLFRTESKRLGRKEPLRLTDSLVSPKAASPLHLINPGMLKMTWQGSALLQEMQDNGYLIAPFDTGSSHCPNQKVVYETYPSAILKALELPYQKYKGKDSQARDLRAEIVEGLSKLHTVKRLNWLGLKLVIKPSLRTVALDDDNALDSLIAAIGAALTSLHPERVSPHILLTSPEHRHLFEEAIAEGWIYVPYPLIDKL